MAKIVDFGRRGGSGEPWRHRLPPERPHILEWSRLGTHLSKYYGFLSLFVLLAAFAWYNSMPAIGSLSFFGRADVVSVYFPICGSGARTNCVVDGDTFWLKGEKVRISDINTPEVSEPQCAAEATLGARATRRLQSLLNAGPFEVRKGMRDQDKYGRKLRTIHRDGQSIGDVLVDEGLAHSWFGYKENWCG